MNMLLNNIEMIITFFFILLLSLIIIFPVEELTPENKVFSLKKIHIYIVILITYILFIFIVLGYQIIGTILLTFFVTYAFIVGINLSKRTIFIFLSLLLILAAIFNIIGLKDIPQNFIVYIFMTLVVYVIGEAINEKIIKE